MPIYTFECPIHGRFERIFSIKLHEEIKKDGIMCEQSLGMDRYNYPIYCGEVATLEWSKPANIQLGKPSIVFINPQTGEAQTATSEYDSPPPGFVKQELKGPIERSKFEQVQGAIASQEDDIFNENIRQKRDEFKKTHLKLIDQHLQEDAQSSSNPELTVRLMKAAKDRIRKKDLVPKKRRTEFRFDVNHKDSSNID